MFNNQPKPRPVLPAEHELRQSAELIIANKAELRPHAIPGGTPSSNMISIAGRNIPVAVAALVVNRQLGIPDDHPSLPPVIKLNTGHKDNNYSVAWGKMSGPIAWETDETFRYIPCFSRYVVNAEGTIKNAANGSVVVESAFETYFKLVPDGPSNTLSNANGEMIRVLAFTKLPEDFFDYGFRKYSHRIGVDPENAGKMGWEPLPIVSFRSNVDGSINTQRNIHEFMEATISKFDERRDARPLLRDLSRTNAIRVGAFSVLMGEQSDPMAFGSAQAEAPMQHSAQAPQTPMQQAPAQQAPSQNTHLENQLNF